MSNQPPEFIPGLKLSELFYREAVVSILEAHFPRLPHSAALIGYGSDVLGFDDARSRDHMWGPRMVLFLPEEDFEQQSAAVNAALRDHLPAAFYGYPTSFSLPDDKGDRVLQSVESGPVEHMVETWTIPAYFEKEIGWNTCQPPTTAQWLAFSEQRLLSLTSGGVWRDDLGLEAARKTLAYYPQEIWFYLMAAQWMKIGQEEPFVGRTAEAGDEVGSRVIAARLVQAAMRLCFQMERRYAPYSKWFGNAFSRLEIAPLIQPHLADALVAANFTERERQMTRAYEILAWRFNSLDIIPPVKARVSFFHDRPFKVIHGDQIAQKIVESIQDPSVRGLPPFVGSVNQISDSTDVVESVQVCKRLQKLYE